MTKYLVLALIVFAFGGYLIWDQFQVSPKDGIITMLMFLLGFFFCFRPLRR